MPTDVTDKNGLNAAQGNIAVKGKGKATEQVPTGVDDTSEEEDELVLEEEEEEEEDDEDDEDDEEYDEDDEDEEGDGSEKIDTSNIKARRTRGVRVDYTSQEAHAKAGLPLDENVEDKMEL